MVVLCLCREFTTPYIYSFNNIYFGVPGWLSP